MSAVQEVLLEHSVKQTNTSSVKCTLCGCSVVMRTRDVGGSNQVRGVCILINHHGT